MRRESAVEARPGKPRSISDEDVERVIVKTLEAQPAQCHALVDALDGGRDRDESERGQPDLAKGENARTN
jgi:hypothetical protein